MSVMLVKIFGVALLLLCGLSGLSVLASRRQRKISPAIVLGAAVSFVLICLRVLVQADVLPALPPNGAMMLTGTTWLSLSFLILKVLDLLVIGEYLIDRHGAYIPDVVRLLIIGIGLVATGLVILQVLLNINPIALVALPTVMTAIVGVALRDTLVRFFSGIALGKIVRVGDWVSVRDHEGIVTGINFSHVTLLTREQAQVTLPNDTVVGSSVTNYSRTPVHVQSILVEVLPCFSPADVNSCLMQAAAAVDGVLNTPKPVAWVHAFKETGVQYRLWFALSDYGQVLSIESRVRTYIWNAFRRKGIRMLSPHMVVQLEQSGEAADHDSLSEEQIVASLREVNLFAVLSPEHLAHLASSAKVQRFFPGERLVRQGDPGEDLYVMLEGLVDVEEDVGGLTKIVNTLHKGDFFGEMSLLTGAPRSVSVVCRTPSTVLVIGKQAVSRVLEGNEELVDRIGAVVAARQLNSQKVRDELGRERALLNEVTETRSIVARMYMFLWGRRQT